MSPEYLEGRRAFFVSNVTPPKNPYTSAVWGQQWKDWAQGFADAEAEFAYYQTKFK